MDSQICSSTQRKVPGRNAKTHRFQNCHVDDPKDVRRAQKLYWVFIAMGEANPFTLEYNSPQWPTELGLLDKLTMSKGEQIHFKTTQQSFIATFLCRTPKHRQNDATKFISQKVAGSQKENLSDISSMRYSFFSKEVL